MKQQSGAVLAGVGAGAALMFYLDPDRGRRRRAMTRNRLASTASAATEAIQTARPDARDGGVRLPAVPVALLAAAGAAMLARFAASRRGNGRAGRARLPIGACLARDLMTADPVCCSPSTTLDEVAKLMRHANIGEIPVVDTFGRPIGVATDRDIVCRVAAEGKNPAAHTIAECMTQPVAAVTTDASLDEIIATMATWQIRRVPVIDEQGTCVGIIAQADIARRARRESVGELVRELSRD
jgi:CBS domain-containing protein